MSLPEILPDKTEQPEAMQVKKNDALMSFLSIDNAMTPKDTTYVLYSVSGTR